MTYFLVLTAATEDDEFGPDGKKFRPGISSSIITELTDCNAALSQQRKKRQVSWIPKELEFKISFHGLFDFCISRFHCMACLFAKWNPIIYLQ